MGIDVGLSVKTHLLMERLGAIYHVQGAPGRQLFLKPVWGITASSEVPWHVYHIKELVRGILCAALCMQDCRSRALRIVQDVPSIQAPKNTPSFILAGHPVLSET